MEKPLGWDGWEGDEWMAVLDSDLLLALPFPLLALSPPPPAPPLAEVAA